MRAALDVLARVSAGLLRRGDRAASPSVRAV
jgi:hypothetical protein